MIEFFKLVRGGRAPQKADPSALGTLPTAAFRYCEPVRSASGYGWYVFLPCDLALIWQDDVIHFSLDGFETKYLLDDAIQYPNFAAEFNAEVPEAIQGFSNPFVARTNDPDILQIWTGCVVRTAPGVTTWVRSPVNLTHMLSFSVLEGVIDTDSWFGPLFANVRLTRRDTPVLFKKDYPLLQILPMRRDMMYDAGKSEPQVFEGLANTPNDIWDGYKSAVVDRMEAHVPSGSYAIAARKRQKALKR